MVSAAASSATHAKPEELYEEVRVSAFSDTGHPILSQSPKAFERHTTALDQPKQAERQQEDLVWADGAEVEGKYNFPGSADNVSTLHVHTIARHTHRYTQQHTCTCNHYRHTYTM